MANESLGNGLVYMKRTLFLMFFTLFNFFELRGHSVHEILGTIPFEHREEIDRLFKMIFLQQDGAFTIFGDKPVSLSGALIKASWETTLKGKAPIVINGWKTWQKYQHLFHLKKYLIVDEKFEIKKTNQIALHIFVINKKAFIETINRHLFLFEKILNKKTDPKKILRDIESGNKTVWSSINHNEMLLGLLLGYGLHNASLFNKRHCKTYDAIIANHAAIKSRQAKLEPFGMDYHPMMKVNPVQFAADLSHPETINLEIKYRKLRDKISTIYAQGDFLEITLYQLTSD